MRSKDQERGSRSPQGYRGRAEGSVRRRAQQRGGNFDSCFGGDFQNFSVKEGKNRVRILPPTWDIPKGEKYPNYGLDIFVHYGVGADNQSYLCLEKHGKKGEKCPCCEEVRALQKKGEDDEAKNLSAKRRVLVWIIDRKAEDDGPQLWSMPWTMDRDIADLSNDDDGSELNVEHPEKGRDVYFTRTGQKKKTQYSGMKISPNDSPISDDDKLFDEWWEYINDHPLDTVLVTYDYEHINNVLSASSSKDDEDDDGGSRRKRSRDEEDGEDDPKPARRRASRDDPADEDEPPPPRRRSSRDEEDEPPARKRSRDEEDEPPTRRRVKDDDDDEPPARRRASRDEEDEPPARKRSRDEEDEPPPRKRVKDEDDDPPPRRRSRWSDEEKEDRDESDDPPPRKRARVDDDDDEPPARKRPKDDDDEPPARRRAAAADDTDDDDPPWEDKKDGRSSVNKRLRE